MKRAFLLAVLLAFGVASHGSAPEGWNLRGAARTGEVHMAKIPAKTKASKGGGRPLDSGKVTRKRVGPEAHQVALDEDGSAWGAFLAEAAESGDLVVGLPSHLIEVGSEQAPQKIIIPQRWVHSAVRTLEALAEEFKDHAFRHTNDEAAAVAHILAAVSKAISEGDLGALNEDKGPHAWARRYLSPAGRVVVGGPLLPIAQRGGTGRARPMEQLSGGFEVLEKAVHVGLEASRQSGVGLDKAATMIAQTMAISFPALSSLSEEPDTIKRIDQIERNITKRLRALGAQERTNPPEMAARNITEALIEDELRRSGKSPAETRRALNFLKD